MSDPPAGGESIGGSERIRTSGDLATTLVFETSPINHSGTLPLEV